MKQIVDVKVVDNYEVAICGGGFAGISAALVAARQGKKTILFEKQFLLGGLATAGLVTIYLPLCDGYGKQVTYGIAEELFKLSIKYGAEAKYPENWLDNIGTKTEKDKRYEVRYNAQIFAILAEQLLLSAGVEIRYGSYVVGVQKNTDKIEYLIVESKSGRTAYKIKSVVDATGDCDIVHFADSPTKNYEQGNVLAAWYYSVGKTGYDLNMIGFADIPDSEKTKDNTPKLLVKKRFSGLDAEELTEQTILSHENALNHFLEKRKTDDSYWITTLPTIPQIRMTRRIEGEYCLKETEQHKYFEDSIGMVSNWKKRGPVYEVPFRTLYSKTIQNLIVAGRCTSVNETMWDIMRVIPCCAVTGQAAGTAAALTDNFSTLDVTFLQEVLKKSGVIIHEKDIIENEF